MTHHDLTGRNFLKELDFTTAEWRQQLASAAELKAAKKHGRRSSSWVAPTSP